jgi:Protein of unknown function (DUF3277).
MQTYSFLDVHAAIVGPGGAFSLGSDAGAADEGIDIEASEDINTKLVGAGGQVMHSLHADRSGKISVNLLKTSPVNGQLTALYNFQTASGANHGQNTLVITNVATGDVITAKQVAFAKYPKLTYAKDGGMNTWEFDAGFIDRALSFGS